MHELTERLLALRDDKNADFQHRILPTLRRESILGVRTPDIRKLAKEYKGTPEAAAFMVQLPHRYFDENNLHGALIETLRDFDACVAALDTFLPHVDNWATCDLMSPWAADVPDAEYYLHMMVAWFFATALAKQYDAALPYLTERKLSAKTHNKAVQKALESYRITPEQKEFLRTLKVKEDK